MRTILLLAVLAAACADDRAGADSGDQKGDRQTPRAEPDVVTVDHILIGVKGEFPVDRTAPDARQLVEKILAELDGGADWDKLKQQYSEDPPVPGKPKGGPYTMDRNQARRDEARIRAGTFAKDDMVKNFGDVSFRLEVGEIGVADYHPADGKFGYHIIKRIR